VEECSKLLVPLMSFYYHDGVRLASLSTMSMLLDSTKRYLEVNKIQDRKLLNDLFAFIYPALIEAVRTERDAEVLVVGIESIHECLAVMGDNCLSSESLKELLDFVKKLIEGTQSRRNKLLKGNVDGDVDDTYIIREEIVKEDDINSEIAEVVGTIVKYHRNTFMAAFQDLIPMVLQMVQKESQPSERQLAICIFDDIVEYTFENSYPLFNHFVPLMMEYALDPHPGVRQASCYGLGVCAQNGSTAFKPLVPQTLEILIKVINEPGSREEKAAPPTENAISSVGKIIQYQGDVLADKLGNLVDMWVSWLPLEVDIIEAKVVHNQLCHFIKTMNNFVFGHGGKNLAKILNIFGRIVDTELITPETLLIIKEILTQLSKQVPAEMMQAALLSITPESQHKLRNLK